MMTNRTSKLARMKDFERLSHVILLLWSVFCLAPFFLLIVSSITDEKAIAQYGYAFWPTKLSLSAYEYLWNHRDSILGAYANTLIVTAGGTIGSLFFTATFAYALSRRETPLRGLVNFLVFFSILFNGGMVASYLIWTEWFHIRDTIWALILPRLLMNGFHIIIMRNYFQTSIHPAIIEAARIDGAGEIQTFVRVVLPLSIPILATIGLFSGLGYWNDWQNGLYFISDTKLYSIQYLLNQMIQNLMILSSGAFGSKAAEQISQLPSATIRMSIAVIGALPILALYPLFQKYFEKGIAIGAVKG